MLLTWTHERVNLTAMPSTKLETIHQSKPRCPVNQCQCIECPNCGETVLAPRCQSPTHESCWYRCSACGSEIPLETDLPEPVVEWTHHLRHSWFPRSSAMSPVFDDSPVDSDLEALIGRIVVMFAWSENRLWNVLPEAMRGKFPSIRDDLKTLDQLKHTWRDWPVQEPPLTVDHMRRSAERRIDAVKTCHGAVVEDRNVFAHGALLIEMESRLSPTRCGESLLYSYSTTDRPPFMARHYEPEHHVELTSARLEPIVAKVEQLFLSVLGLEMLSDLTWGAEANDDLESQGDPA